MRIRNSWIATSRWLTTGIAIRAVPEQEQEQDQLALGLAHQMAQLR
jgi:hypothetical protein